MYLILKISGIWPSFRILLSVVSAWIRLGPTCLIKGLPTTSEDLSVFVVFLIFLFYFSLQQIFSNGFSVIFHPISMKFGMLIVLDETKSLNIISSQ